MWHQKIKDLSTQSITNLQHCKSPPTQRNFKYLFISLATRHIHSYKTPVQTRQRWHIQCKSFPRWLGDSCCYEYVSYITVTLALWLDLFQWTSLFWLECKKEKSVWLWTFSWDNKPIQTRFSQRDCQLGICMWWSQWAETRCKSPVKKHCYNTRNI